MRILFNTIPCASHVDPLVPLARALHSAGHDVRVSTSTAWQIVGRSGVDSAITAAGLTAVVLESRVPESQHISAARPRIPGALVQPIGRETWPAVRDELLDIFQLVHPTDPSDPGSCPVLDDLVGFARAWRPDLLLWDFLGPTASIAAEVLGIPHLRLVFAQDKVAMVNQWQPAGDDRFDQWLRPLLRRHGLTYATRMLLGQWSIDAQPIRAEGAGPVPYLPMRRISYTGAEPLPRWLYAPPRRPRVCLTLGWSIMRNFDRFGLSAADLGKLATALDAEFVVTVEPEQFPDRLPDNVRAVGYVPLDVLLPTCSAIVHHGGTGTLAAAVAHRVPQVIIPAANWDEANDARHVADQGAGLALHPDEFSAGALHDRLKRVLGEPSFQAGATALYTRSLAAPHPVDMVGVLERIAAQPKG
jgi:L-rhodinosyltransferase/glycosyltransferase